MSTTDLNNKIVAPLVSKSLVEDLRQIIEQARGRVASTVNSELTMMYWHIGERINRDVLGNQRAEYGKQIVSTVLTQLQEEYGAKGFDEKSIRRMMQFAQFFPDIQIVAPPVRQFEWSHFSDSYVNDRWNKRILQSKFRQTQI